jgi:CBS domain-containing membrane protein
MPMDVAKASNDGTTVAELRPAADHLTEPSDPTSRHHVPPSEHRGLEPVGRLLTRMRLEWLLRHFPPRIVWATYVCVNGFITIALLALLALATESPFVFPSLGPTAYLFFFSPLAETASPRNTILGHAIGLICGYAAFALTASFVPPFAAQGGVHGARVLAAALSLSATGALMALFRVSHPPAGATTLIVSLGIIAHPKELVVIEVAVVLLTMQAFVINRLAGLPYPLWKGATRREG